MAATLSVGQRVVMHLYRYKHIDPSDVYNIPWELTQDGIAAALRISRAHASIELKKLREAGKADEKLAHIKAGKVKRKAYVLTQKGLDEVPSIQEFAAAENIDIDALLDLRKQDPVILLSELCDEDRNAFGCACAFRVPVPIALLPQTKNLTIPSDVDDRTVISEQLRNNILNSANEDERQNWMIYAANVWLDDKGRHILGDEAEYATERLYHLVEAGVSTQTCKHIANEGAILTYYANEDVAENLSKIQKIPDNYAFDVLSTMIEVNIKLRKFITSRDLISKLRPYSPEYADLYEADILYIEGDKEKAKSLIKAKMENIPAADVRFARYLIDEGMIDEAESILMSISINDDTDISVGAEKFIQLARIYSKKGDKDGAYHSLMKARATFSSESMKKRIDLAAKEYNLKP